MKRTRFKQRTRFRRRAVKDNPSYMIGGYAAIDERHYERLLEELDSGPFHFAQWVGGFTVKVINEEIRQALIKTA